MDNSLLSIKLNILGHLKLYFGDRIMKRSDKKATAKQQQALLNFGINPPPTKAACRNLLSFLIDCHYGETTKAQRVAWAKTMQEKWLGHRVICDGNPGTIDYMTVVDKALLKIIADDKDNSSPFRFHVRGDDGKGYGIKCLSLLKIVENNETNSES